MLLPYRHVFIRPSIRIGLALFALLACLTLTASTAHAGPGKASAKERRFVGLLNQERARQGMAPLQISRRLTSITNTYARANARTRRLDHRRDRPYARRARAAGCSKWNGPVMAYGYRSARSTLRSWLRSPAHRQVVLDPQSRYIGPGFFGRSAVTWIAPCRSYGNASGDYGSGFRR